MQNKVCVGSVSTSEDRKKQKKRLKGFLFPKANCKCGVKELKTKGKKKGLTPPYREVKREGLLERETKRWWAQEEQIGAKKLLG